MNAQEKIERIRKECGKDGWDGYAADRVSEDTCDFAVEMIFHLPRGDRMWEPIPTNEGEIRFECGDDFIAVYRSA